jgi:tetratricopeptide (TPR) repeat protein
MQKAVASVAQEAGALLRARGEELLGRVDRAEELYRRACEKRPDDFLVFLQAAEFFRRSDRPAEAEPFLRTVLSPALNAPPELVSRARRLLAIDLAWTAADCRAEAVPLLDANRAGRQHTVSDTLARAAILGAEAKQRPAALRLFDEVLKKHPATSEDLFLLARLLEADGQHSRAREVLLQLQDAEPDCPQYVAAHVRCLIASGDLDDAAVYLGKLELREPRSRRVRELHAALLKARAAVADSQH